MTSKNDSYQNSKWWVVTYIRTTFVWEQILFARSLQRYVFQTTMAKTLKL